MERNKSRDIASLAGAAVLVVLECIGMVLSFQELNVGMFRYYTILSNGFMLLSAAIWGVYTGEKLRDGFDIPGWVRFLKYAATATVLLTFVVVCAVLAPREEDYFSLLTQGSFLYTHLLCPLVAAVTFLALDAEPEVKPAYVGLSLLPTVLYAAVAMVLNILGVWYGPYDFLHVYEQPVWLSVLWGVAMLLVSLLLAALLYRGSKKLHREYVY